MSTIDDLDDAWNDHVDRCAGALDDDRWAEEDYREMCDEAGVPYVSDAGHRLWAWRNDDGELGASRLGVAALVALGALWAHLALVMRQPVALGAFIAVAALVVIAACIWCAWPCRLREVRR